MELYSKLKILLPLFLLKLLSLSENYNVINFKKAPKEIF
jgi:hypothetical protein